MTTSTINTIPVEGSSFLSTLQTFLREEDAERFNLILNPFVQANGLHSTGASLTGDPGATIAFPAGFYVSETGTITYNDDTAHHWVIIFKDTTTVVGGDWVRVSGTHYLFDPVSASQPTVPDGGLILMDVVTASGSITTVTDLRNTSAFAVPEDVFKVKVSSDDTTTDYLLNKLAAGSGITLTETNPGADEDVTIAADSKTTISTNDTTAGFLEDKITAGDGLAETVQNAFGDEDLKLDIDLATTSGLEFNSGKLQVNTITNGGVGLNSNGTVVDINGLTPITVLDETNDEFIVEDDSQTGEKKRKIVFDNIAGVATQAQSEDGTDTKRRITPLGAEQAIAHRGRATIFTSNGTYNVPEGITRIHVIAIGAGGGGGASTVGAGTNGGGGGGGGVVEAILTVTGGGTETVTIGTGGTGGPSSTSGTAGGNTTITGVVATGGGGGVRGVSGGTGGTGGAPTSTALYVYRLRTGVDGGGSASSLGGKHGFQGNDGGAGGNPSGSDGGEVGLGGGGGTGADGTGGDGSDGYMVITPVGL